MLINEECTVVQAVLFSRSRRYYNTDSMEFVILILNNDILLYSPLMVV
jgi:hypothetical protein